MNNLLRMIAHTTLLRSDVAEKVLAGTATISEVTYALALHLVDCEAVLRGNPTTTFQERIIVRAFAVAGLLAVLAIHQDDAESGSLGSSEGERSNS